MVGVVAQLTFSPQAFFVDIVLGVAMDAIGLNGFEFCREMTFLAGGHGMYSKKRKACQVMIESNVCPPCRFIVAFSAIFSFLTFVYIIRFMAAIACFREFDFFFDWLGVAQMTVNVFM